MSQTRFIFSVGGAPTASKDLYGKGTAGFCYTSGWQKAGSSGRAVLKKCVNTQCQIVLYGYQKTRNASHPREFLKDFSGVCVTDGYQVYHTVENEHEDLKIAGC